MNDIVERNNIDLSDPVSKPGIEHFVHAWNHHKISGPKGCLPIENMIWTIRTQHFDEGIIPTVSEANDGVLKKDPTFGIDPLSKIWSLWIKGKSFLIEIL